MKAKRFLSVFLTIVMILGMIPASVFATGIDDYPELTLGEVTTAVIDEGSGYAYFRFTTASDGTYYFTSYANSDTYGYLYDASMVVIASDDDGGENNNFRLGYDLTAGTTYVYGCRYYGGGTGSFDVELYREVEATGILIGDGNDVTICEKTYYEFGYSFLPDHSYCYDYVEWTSSDENVLRHEYGGRFYANSVGDVTVTASTEGGLSSSVKVTVTPAPYINADEAVTVTPDGYDYRAIYKFSPTESGTYNFKSVSDVESSGSIYDESMIYLLKNGYANAENGNFMASCYLTKGKTYYLVTYNTNGTEPFDIIITRAPALESISLTNSKIKGCVGSYFDEMGVICDPADAAPESITWTSSDVNIAYVQSDGFIGFLSAGKVTITATTESGLEATCEVTVVEPTPIEENVPADVEVTGGETETFAFTPEVEGYYIVRISDVSDPEEKLYVELNGYGAANSGKEWLFRRYLYEGSEKRIKTRIYDTKSTETVSYKITVAREVEPESITLSESEHTGKIRDQFQLTYSVEPWNVPDYINIEWSSSNDDVAHVDYYGNVSLRAEGTAVITATASSGAKGECAVTVEGYDPIALDEIKTVTIENGGDVAYYSFKPEETAYYSFYSMADEESDTYGYLYDSAMSYITGKDGGGDNGNFKITYKLEAGVTYYLGSAYYGGWRTGSFDVTIVKTPSATEMTLSRESVRGYPGDGFYVDVYFSPSGTAPEDVTWTSGDESVATVNQYGQISLAGAGETVITATSENGLTAECTVKTLERAVMTEDVPVTVEIDSEYYYEDVQLEFTPGESGKYCFEARNFSKSIQKVHLEGGYSSAYNNERLTCTLEAGNTYVISTGVNVFNGSSGQGGSYDVIVSKVTDPTSVSLDKTEYEGRINGSFEIEASIAPWNGDYGDGVVWTSDNDAVASVSTISFGNYGRYASVTLRSVGSAVIRATLSSGEYAECTVTVKDYEPIAAGDTKDVVIENGGEMAYFKFVPEETGYYNFYSSSEDDTYGILYDSAMNQIASDDSSGYDGNFRISRKLTAGEQYIFCARYWSSSRTGSFPVTLEKAPAASSIRTNISNIRTFVGDDSDYYSMDAYFYPDDAAPETITWTTSDESVVKVDEYGALTVIGAGEATVTATSENGLTAECAVTVLDPIVMTEDVPARVEIVDNKTAQLVFTPSDGGDYCFGVSNKPDDCGTYMWLQSYSSSYNGRLTCYLEAGRTYRLDTHFDWGCENGEYDVTVSKCVEPTEVLLNKTEYSGYINTCLELYAMFEPWNADDSVTLTWTSSDNSVATVDNYGNVSLKSVGTAVIKAALSESVYAECTVTVKDYEPIAVGDTKNVVIENAGDYEYYRFVPEESGWYVFKSTGPYDTSGIIYDSNFNCLASVSYGGGYNNFKIIYEFTAGKEYYLAAGFNYSDAVGNYTVTLTKAPSASSISLDHSFLTGFAGDTYYTYYLSVEYTPSDAALENITWTSSDEDVVTVDEYGNLTYVGAGEATVTATSENGLTAECAVTVLDPIVMTEDVPVRVTITGNRTMQLVFTPSESGEYCFGTSNVPDGCSTNMYLQNYSSTSNGRLVCSLIAGSTYRLETCFDSYNNGGNGEYDVTVSKAADPEKVNFDKTSYTGYLNATFDINASFEPWNASNAGIVWTSSDSTVAAVSNGHVKLKSVGDATIRATIANGEYAECTVTVKDFEPIAAGDTKDVVIGDQGAEVLFKFIPEEDGYYSFYSISDGDTYGRILNSSMSEIWSDDDSGPNANFLMVRQMTAGREYILGARFLSSNLTGAFKVTLVKSPEAQSVDISTRSIRGYVRRNYSYLINAEFSPFYAIPGNITWTSSNENVAEISYDSSGNCWVQLAGEGETDVTFTVSGGVSASCHVTAFMPGILTVDVPERVDFGNYTVDYMHKMYVFTPTTSGIYCFGASNYSKNLNSVNINCENYTGGTGKISVYLSAGQNYYINTTPNEYYDNEDLTYDLTVSKATPPVSVTLSETSYTGYKNTWYYPSVTCEPWNTANSFITWISSDETVATVSDEGAVHLIAPGVATISADCGGGVKAECTVTVKDYEPISLDETKDASIEREGSVIYYSFTPEEDGYYAFFSDSEYDTYGYILNESMNHLASDDDGGGHGNFRVKYEMKAGTTYVLGARYSSSSRTGSFSVKVERAKRVKSVTILTPPTRTVYYEGYVQNYLNYNGLSARIEWEDGSTEDWTYGRGVYVGGERVSVSLGDTAQPVLSVICGGMSDGVALSILPNPVESLELVSGTNRVYMENVNGCNDTWYNPVTGDNEEYFRYYVSEPTDAVIRINYKDGTSREATVGSEVGGYYVGWYDDQYNSPWTLGSDNYLIATYLGETVPVPVTVTANTVAGISIKHGMSATFYEYANGYFTGEEGNSPFWYYLYTDAFSDVTIEISFNDGSKREAAIGDIVNGARIQLINPQGNDTWWTVGGDNYLTVSYAGFSERLPVTLLENPVEGIEVVTPPSREYVYGDDEYGWLAEEDYYEFYPTDITGLVFKVRYKGGTVKTFTATGQDGESFDGQPYYLFFTQGNVRPGNIPVTFKYMGKTATYNVVLKAESDEQNILYGDVDNNGVVNLKDATLIRR
ncbi:MAG: Ig-like domain-containing protein, partial [Clostridia bacterium]|nr:Ig-like domain-containing protein [Clostridia bacterium]